MGRQKKYHSEKERKKAIKISSVKYRNSDNGKIKVKENIKKYRELNKEKVAKQSKIINKKWFENNPNYQKEYRKINLVELKIKRNKREKERKDNDLIYKLKCDISRSFRQSFKRKGYNKKSRTHEILGCSFEHLKLHLESKFLSWMNWQNHGRYNGELNYGWDIDHIIPLSTAITEEDVINLNHHTNLQPLCGKVNRDIKKGY